VWNRKLQSWVEVEITEEQAAASNAKAGISAPQSSNAFASGSNQNSGNVITDKSSTRLHAPPGGRTTISLGYAEPEADIVKEKVPTPSAKAIIARKEELPSTPSAKAINLQQAGKVLIFHLSPSPPPDQPKAVAPSTVPAALHKPAEGRSVSSNAYASGSNQNAGNFITDRPTTRTSCPPGGRTSITLG
ncbi:unnamed protein product, partial [Chrysoparadoxa australica]